MTIVGPRDAAEAPSAPRRELRVVHDRGRVDLEAARRAVSDLLFACDLRVQERLTKQVADRLRDHLAPQGVGVAIEAEHMCMALRGVRATGSRTVTSAVCGRLREDTRSRQEFFALTGVNG